MSLILASTSSARRKMLSDIGLEYEATAPMVDEQAIKETFLANGADARTIADALAEAKAVKLSSKNPGDLVIGSDQILALEDGRILDKPQSPDEAVAHLHLMAGKTHKLFSAVVAAEKGAPVWRFVSTSRMTVRHLSPSFIENYVDQYWQHIQHCVGCYRIEAEGAQLFSRIEGNHFDIMGLPLLPLLSWLRERGILTS